ncbi:MAG: NCS2 family permease, partial [Mailhella sp.]|nr:NCS2 family permease [Mailhella sp.]
MLESLFKLRENGVTAKSEMAAGLTTFMTMAYILAVNPAILSASGMDPNAILMATALASFFGCLAMALLANYPFALAPGMGLNAYFAFTICGSMGYSWQFALLAVFIEGIIFILLSLLNVREAIFDAIPLTLKRGVSVGIGLFIAFIGLQGAHIVVDSATLVSLVNFTEKFSTVGISAVVAVIGVVIISVLYVKRFKGAILIGIFATWGLGILCQLAGIYQVTPEEGYYSLIPAWHSFNIGALGETFGQCFRVDFSSVSFLDMAVIVMAFLFVDIFDTLGTLIGVATKADMLDEKGKLPRIKSALLADALATTVGAVFGTSTTTTYVESSSGVAEGGRTGLTALVVGLLFLAAIFFAPLFTAIPGFATAPALIFVGFLMISAVTGINFGDLTEAIPAYLCLLVMPLAYSISDGIAAGIISYTLINLFAGKTGKISPLMYVLAVLFVLKY